MKKIKQKLNDQSGVSILFALIMMLVAAMVSLTIVSTSVSALKRTHSIRNSQQDSLSLDSATLLIKRQLNQGEQFSLSYEERNIENTNECGYFNDEVKEITRSFVNDIYNENDIELFTLQTGTEQEIYDSVKVSYHLQQGSDLNDCVVVFLLETDTSKQYLKYTLSKLNDRVIWNFQEASGKE